MQNFTVGYISLLEMLIVSIVDGPREGARGTDCLVSIEKALEPNPKAVEDYETTQRNKSTQDNI